MGRGKKTGVYLFLAAALTLLLLLAFPAFWYDCALSVATGRQAVQYTCASAGSDGTVYAAGVRDGTWVLARGSLGGGRADSRTLDSLGMDGVVTVDQLYACSDGGAVLCVYEEREGLVCRAYYLAPGAKEARQIYSVPCEDRESVAIEGLTERGGVATFLLRQEDEGAAFRYALGDDTAGQLASVTPQQAAAALFVLPDGQPASVSGGRFSIGSNAAALPGELRPVRGWRLTDGACLLDGESGALWRADMVTGQWTYLTALDETPAGDVVSAGISPDGGALFLSDDGRLLYLWDGAFQDCSAALYRPQWQSVLILVLSAAGVLLLALALWYFLCEYRRLQISLVARRGAAVALVLVVLVAGAVRWAVVPYFEDRAAWEAERYLRRAASDTAAIPDAERMSFRSTDDGTWLEDGRTRTALSVLGYGEAWRQAAARAMEGGEAFQQHSAGGIGYYSYFVRTGSGRLSVVRMESGPYLEEAARGIQMMARMLWGLAGLALVAVLLALLGLRQRLHRVVAGLDALHAGHEHVQVVDRTRDEVGAMADSLNVLAEDLRQTNEADLRRGDLYARFLPAQIAQLLGEESVEQIDKQSFASHRMAIMHVSFSFDQRVFETRSKALFDNINEITESTAKIISAQGGTILSFSHEGFDAFFPAGDDAPISAAVVICQEAAAINRARQRRDISPVSLHIALDEGEVMLGVVGDEDRMQATAVSASFSTIRMLTGLFSRFEASILCTEQIETRAGEYGRRYIGKAHDGPELVRVYEIYDGDAQTVRQTKAETERAFSDGVYTLYAGGYTAAKRAFMEISRRSGGDGAAKFYLYLADRFEKEPPEEVSLDG